jgi:uncharacterized protein (UPF0333 family)
MFRYFHRNKFNYNEKGQLAPVFIVIMVILLIMAIATINLSKVSFIKTDTSNAVDAGALAAGSAMANLFNSLAQANSLIEMQYWDFLANISVLYVSAFGVLTTSAVKGNYVALECALMALPLACPAPCRAANRAAGAAVGEKELGSNSKIFQTIVIGIMVATAAYPIGAYFQYLMMRDAAERGRNNAIELGHSLAFRNSGIGAKLNDQQREEFRNFLKAQLGPNNEYTFSWQDAQNRAHSVKSRVTIDPVDKFLVKTTVLPWPADVALLDAVLQWLTGGNYDIAAELLGISCVCQACCAGITAPFCCPCWAATCVAAIGMLLAGIAIDLVSFNRIIQSYLFLMLAWAGMMPGPVVTNPSFMDTICWVEDIDHNRRVRVDTWQSHQGADLGFWETKYPDTHSYSIVDFRGNGEIYPPVLRHDASIIATDVLAVSGGAITDLTNECLYVRRQIPALQELVIDANANARNYDDVADMIEAEAVRLSEGTLPDGAGEITVPTDNLSDYAGIASRQGNFARHLADASRQQALDTEAEITRLRKNYPYCFTGTQKLDEENK